jgi:hypothetical protein
MNTSNLGLSTMATGQMDRMIDDLSWITYPLHLAVGIIKDFFYALFLISAAILAVGVWMFTAHDTRADLIKNFAAEQTIYRVDLASGKAGVQKAGYLVQPEEFRAAFNGCMGKDEQLKNTIWWDHNWLAEKSDMFQKSYIVASHNIAALKIAVSRARANRPVYSFRYACTTAMDIHSVVIPNAPVVDVAFLHRTDESIMDSANAKYNWFTGMCKAGANCTATDFSPRNDSIYMDAVMHQVTPNQDAALKALAATSTPEFWIGTAHANGVYGKDAIIAALAKKNNDQLANDILRHKMTDEEAFARGVYITGFFVLCFLAFIGWWIARRITLR